MMNSSAIKFSFFDGSRLVLRLFITDTSLFMMVKLFY
jgi:hypothetical protein